MSYNKIELNAKMKSKIINIITIILFFILHTSCTSTKTYSNGYYSVDGKIIYCADGETDDIPLSENDILVSYSLKWNAKGDDMETDEFFMNVLFSRITLHYRCRRMIKYHDKSKKFGFRFRTNQAFLLNEKSENIYNNEIKIALFESIKFSPYQIKMAEPIGTNYVTSPYRAFDIINLNDFDSGYSNGYTVYINKAGYGDSLSPILNNELAELVIENSNHQRLARVVSVNDFLDSYKILVDEVSDDEIKLLTLCAIVYKAMYTKLKE